MSVSEVTGRARSGYRIEPSRRRFRLGLGELWDHRELLFFRYGRFPDWHALVIPFFLGMAFFTALGVGLWLSALNVRYRDIEYVVPFLAQTWLFLSPVVYGSTAVPSHLHWLISLNPMTGVVDGVRGVLLGR